MTLDRAARNIGHAVVYMPAGRRDLIERGVITSVNRTFVFVRYGDDQTSKATPPERLFLADFG